jgi:phosphatidylserine/phosphatidylglycerophosphate/cardiolipin synthase-like enzyme
MIDEILFTRAVSIAEAIERRLQATTKSIDAALYRLNSLRLAQALENAVLHGMSVRLVLDHHKYMRTPATRAILAGRRIPFRLSRGRKGRWSKMHHKFVILDGETVLTGSYNWTIESEEQNYENMFIIRDPSVVLPYAQEFEELWAASAPVGEQ